MLNFIKGYRTLIFNGIITGLAGLQAADVAQFVPEKYVPLAVSAIGFCNIVLRFFTNSPVGGGEKTIESVEVKTGTSK